jgi:hypothetical protein
MHESIRNDVTGTFTGPCRPDDQVMAIVLRPEDLASKTTENMPLLAEPFPRPQTRNVLKRGVP